MPVWQSGNAAVWKAVPNGMRRFESYSRRFKRGGVMKILSEDLSEKLKDKIFFKKTPLERLQNKILRIDISEPFIVGDYPNGQEYKIWRKGEELWIESIGDKKPCIHCKMVRLKNPETIRTLTKNYNHILSLIKSIKRKEIEENLTNEDKCNIELKKLRKVLNKDDENSKGNFSGFFWRS